MLVFEGGCGWAGDAIASSEKSSIFKLQGAQVGILREPEIEKLEDTVVQLPESVLVYSTQSDIIPTFQVQSLVLLCGTQYKKITVRGFRYGDLLHEHSHGTRMSHTKIASYIQYWQ